MKIILFFILYLFPCYMLVSQNILYVYTNAASGYNHEKKNFNIIEAPENMKNALKSTNSRFFIDAGIGYTFIQNLSFQVGGKYNYIGQKISINNPNNSVQTVSFNYQILELSTNIIYRFSNVFKNNSLQPFICLGGIFNKYPNINKEANLDIANKPNFTLLSYKSYKKSSEIMFKANFSLGLEKQLGDKGSIFAGLYYILNPFSQKLFVGRIDNIVYPNYPVYDVEYNTVATFENYDSNFGISIGYKIPIIKK